MGKTLTLTGTNIHHLKNITLFKKTKKCLPMSVEKHDTGKIKTSQLCGGVT